MKDGYHLYTTFSIPRDRVEEVSAWVEANIDRASMITGQEGETQEWAVSVRDWAEGSEPLLWVKFQEVFGLEPNK